MKDKLSRIDIELENIFRKAATLRIVNGVDKKMRSLPELTDMVKRCPSFKKTIEELSTIPTKEDLRKMLR